jgi:hypothetical protein
MKTRVVALVAAVVGLFAAAAGAATRLGSTGCCPFCR